ncbi:MAG: response regulator [Nitrospinae bacterium]|nr:response regulator [Nitrospinota bacterium]
MDKLLKILIIDDDRSFRKIVTRMMVRAGLKVEITEAINCAEGVEQLNKKVFDCALLDYQLPDANGIHLLQEILHFGGTSTPIIFVTGKGDEMIAAQALKTGALDYIPKEKLSPEILSQCIHNVIKVHDLELRANQAEYLLVENEKHYKRIVETISEIVFQLDPARNISFINSSSRTLGFEPEELIGKSVDEILDVDDSHLSMIGTNRVGKRATFNLEVRFKLKKGSPIWSEMGFLPGLIDSYGLWNLPEELVSIQNLDKEFQGTLCMGRFIR